MRPERIDPALLGALQDADAFGTAGLTPHLASIGVHATAGSMRPDSAVIFLHCDENASFDQLRQRGIHVNQPQGTVRTASLPLAMIGELSQQNGVRRIIGARYLRPLMDVAQPRAGVPPLVQRTGLKGRNVIVGVIDSGIDAQHPAFGQRVLRIWDQTLAGSGVTGAPYGSELSAAQFQTSRDTHGHGTHVASIASGDDALFPGIAPAADLIIVKTDFQDAHLADAVQYIFRLADELQRPAVINMSLGGHADAHDGSDSLSQIIDSESGPGRIVCCAAGNEGNDNIHAHAVCAPGSTRSLRLRAPPNALLSGSLNGWYSGAGAALEVAIRSPGGFVTPFQPVGSSMPQVHVLGDARVRIANMGPDPANGDPSFWVQIQGAAFGMPVRAGIWQLMLRNGSAATAAVDVWALSDEHNSLGFSGTSISDKLKIGSPGSAAEAVTVAAFTTSKIGWTDSSGVGHQVGLLPDTIADFSSEGPLRNGAQKPDLAAPGAMIVAALSQFASALPADIVDARHQVMAGTSMATPLISGLVALLLERDPTLSPSQLKAMLRARSAIPGRPAGSFDPKWGFGLIDASGL
jgi:subtilisin family serine protease